MSTHFHDHPCDLCGSDAAMEVPYARLYTGGQPIHICTRCGFVYVRPRRSSLEVARAWSEEIFGANYTSRIPAVLARKTYVADFIDCELGLAGKRLAHIGAGEGRFMEIVRDQYRAEPFGIEPSPANCRLLQDKGFACFQGTIEEYAASPGTGAFDLVTVLWTLENCTSCMDMLRTARTMLPTGGHIAVATGSRILVPFKKTLQDYLEPTPADTHSFRFSAATLRGALAAAGFETVKQNRYHDTDYLVTIARRPDHDDPIPWEGDDWVKVYDFFERWHRESVHYR